MEWPAIVRGCQEYIKEVVPHLVSVHRKSRARRFLWKRIRDQVPLVQLCIFQLRKAEKWMNGSCNILWKACLQWVTRCLWYIKPNVFHCFDITGNAQNMPSWLKRNCNCVQNVEYPPHTISASEWFYVRFRIGRMYRKYKTCSYNACVGAYLIS